MKPEQLESWIDINLPPSMAVWLKESFGLNAKSFFELGFIEKSDVEVFRIAQHRLNTIVITTKDIDFLQYQKQAIAPLKILHITTGNISNKQLKELVLKLFPEVIRIFTKTNQQLIEITKQP